MRQQWTRSGWDRENAILQGLLADGCPLPRAEELAAQYARPMTPDVALGILLIRIFKWCIVLPLVLLMLFAIPVVYRNHQWNQCMEKHQSEGPVTLTICGPQP